LGRRALGLGEHGEIEATPQVRDADGKWKRAVKARSAERWRARCYQRGYDGVIGEISRVARTKRLAIEAVEAAHHLKEPERVWDQSNSAKALASIFAGSGFPWAIPHTVRRTVARLLDQAGVPIAQIADQLGHSDPAMTASVYLGRDLMGDKRSVAEHL